MYVYALHAHTSLEQCAADWGLDQPRDRSWHRSGVGVQLTVFGLTALELRTCSGLASRWKSVRLCCRSLVLQQLPPLGGFFRLLWIQGPGASLI